ncbi:hypothetical protein V6N11_081303 [Hibiscus sabdariffa]|uniref:Uncharacterized protein n=1 Tax=Hibiscus sabdariffa TaxID=183260 RepID=A0ABR2QJZ4_9ROSI
MNEESKNKEAVASQQQGGQASKEGGGIGFREGGLQKVGREVTNAGKSSQKRKQEQDRIDSEKTSILITTNHPGRIDEEIIVEVGSKSYVIHIFELGFKDVTLDPLIQANLKKVPATTVSSQSEDSSECSSSEERNGDDVEQPSLIVKVADKEDGGIIEQEAGMLKSQENEKVNLEPHGQEKTLDVEENLIKGLGAEEIVGQKNVVGQMSRSWAEVLTGGENNLGLTQTTGQKEESNQVLGQNGGNQKDKVFVENVGPLQKEVKVEGILMDDGENENKKYLDTLYSFRELESTFPLKSPDLAKDTNSKLLGRSLSDSDLRNKWERARKEAKETLDMGEKYGLTIIGKEEEALKDLSVLEFQE